MNDVIKDLTAEEIVGVLAAASEAGEDIWEAAISAASPWVEQINKHKYVLGDLACLVEKKYGEDRIGAFAKAIKAEAARVKEYRTVCSRFDENMRRQIFDNNPNIVYSHLRSAGKIFKVHPGMYGLKHVNRMLDMASKYDWTSEKFGIQVQRLLGKKRSPKKLVDATGEICGWPVLNAPLTLEFDDPKEADALRQYFEKGKKAVRVVIYPLDGEEPQS